MTLGITYQKSGYKKLLISILIGYSILVQNPNIPIKEQEEKARKRLEQIIKKEEAEKWKIWELFWKCEDFNFDYSNPNHYYIDKEGKCKPIKGGYN